MNRVDLDQAILGPKFETQTPQSFHDYVCSLKELKALDKPIRPPRIKREKVTHKIDAETKLCAQCGKRVRSEKAVCKPTVEELDSEDDEKELDADDTTE